MSKERARPSQFKNDPDFSVTAATGSTTSARDVTALGAISSETTNALSKAANASLLFSRSNGSTPPTRSASISPELTAEIISEVERPICEGKELTDQASAISCLATESVTGRPPGSKLPIAPA